MSDPNLSDFYGRVARIQKARSKGYGFEAPGTLGRSSYAPPRTRRRSILGPVVFLLVCAVLLKGAIYQSVGADSYAERVALDVGAGRHLDPDRRRDRPVPPTLGRWCGRRHRRRLRAGRTPPP